MRVSRKSWRAMRNSRSWRLLLPRISAADCASWKYNCAKAAASPAAGSSGPAKWYKLPCTWKSMGPAAFNPWVFMLHLMEVNWKALLYCRIFFRNAASGPNRLPSPSTVPSKRWERKGGKGSQAGNSICPFIQHFLNSGSAAELFYEDLIN